MSIQQAESILAEPEQIEGLGGDEDASLGDYPIDTMLIRTEPRTVHEVLRRISKGSFVMDPEFQRDFIWKEDRQSKLIESALMRIPLPVFYLAEDPHGRMVVVDGLQRLTTFQRFVNNELRLQLPDHPQLDGKHFEDLSPKLQNRVEDCNLILYIIDAKVPERARLDIFERVNSGGVALTRQQMRNALYMGAATRFLREEAATALFKQATGNSLDAKTMRDREFVNRFCAFQLLSLDDYRDMDDFLAQALRKMNTLPPQSLTDLSAQFRTSLANNYEVFGTQAFRKHSEGSKGRSVINASLWDVMSTGLSRYPEQLVTERKDALRSAFYALLGHKGFSESITSGVLHIRNIRRRVEMAGVMFREVFDGHST